MGLIYICFYLYHICFFFFFLAGADYLTFIFYSSVYINPLVTSLGMAIQLPHSHTVFQLCVVVGPDGHVTRFYPCILAHFNLSILQTWMFLERCYEIF